MEYNISASTEQIEQYIRMRFRLCEAALWLRGDLETCPLPLVFYVSLVSARRISLISPVEIL